MRRLLTDATMALGELYMDGLMVPAPGRTADPDGGVWPVLDVIGANLAANAAAWPGLRLHLLAGRIRRRLDQWNPQDRSRRNVAHHYDLDGGLYDLFLDADRQYSCAYFATGTETLDQAQVAKKAHIAAKLRLDRPGLRVLDIGCGWGGLAITLARDHGCLVTGITLSAEQLQAAQARADDAGVADRVSFLLSDYRDQAWRAQAGQFDRIVSVGMFEHVGVNHFATYFAAVHRLLAPDGVALIHTIARSHGPASTNRWVAKYIFPGGYSPALSEMLPAIERSGLIATDIEVLRLHYAHTLRLWRTRFLARRPEAAALYDDRFSRMFEFYLAVSELAFRWTGTMNAQVQLVRRADALPITRDYMMAPPSRAVRTDLQAD